MDQRRVSIEQASYVDNVKATFQIYFEMIHVDANQP